MKEIIGTSVLLILISNSVLASDTPMAEIEMPGMNGSLELSPRVQSETSFRVAARTGHLKEVQRLLIEGVDVNGSGEFGETALMYAARFNFPQVVATLLDHGAETNARDSEDNTALQMAAENCSVKAARMLVSKGVNVYWINSGGKNALIAASEDGCFLIVKILTATGGVTLSQKDNQMKTALRPLNGSFHLCDWRQKLSRFTFLNSPRHETI